jgi:hypothetical protein
MPRAELALLYEQTRRAYAGDAMRDPAFAAFQEVALRHAIAPRYAFDHLAASPWMSMARATRPSTTRCATATTWPAWSA